MRKLLICLFSRSGGFCLKLAKKLKRKQPRSAKKKSKPSKYGSYQDKRKRTRSLQPKKTKFIKCRMNGFLGAIPPIKDLIKKENKNECQGTTKKTKGNRG
jgi:hypothetical protein